jgi:hypothetical protein
VRLPDWLQAPVDTNVTVGGTATPRSLTSSSTRGPVVVAPPTNIPKDQSDPDDTTWVEID